jgi:hypothetical protein
MFFMLNASSVMRKLLVKLNAIVKRGEPWPWRTPMLTGVRQENMSLEMAGW